MSALRIRNVAKQTHAFERARIGAGNGRRVELEPAIGVVALAEAEVAGDLAVAALLHGKERQSESLPVGRVQVLGEIVGSGGEISTSETEPALEIVRDLDLVAARVPFPHGRARGVD